MPAPSGGGGGGSAGALTSPAGPARDVDGLIRDLQRINLSQCMDQLTADIHQLSSMERQLNSWHGLYVRCPDPEPDELGAEPADKKSSSGYSTESASPPGSRNTSGDGTETHGPGGYGTERPEDGYKTGGYRTERPEDGYKTGGYRTERPGDARGTKENGRNGHSVNGYEASGLPLMVGRGPDDGPDAFESGRYTVNSFKPRGTEPAVGVVTVHPGRAGPARRSERTAGAIHRPVAGIAAPGNLNGLSNGPGGAGDRPTTSGGVTVGGRPDLPPRPAVGPDSPAVSRHAGLLQSSVSHSSQPRRLTPLLSRAPFCPPAASTPTLLPKQPRSPKTLRFAASHELIPPDSPSRRQMAAGAPPRPGILRSRAGSEESQEGLSRPAPPGWRAGSSSSSPSPGRARRPADSSGSGGRDAADSAERFSRVVSALSRLEAELSAGGRRRPPEPRAACGTAQFVRLPPRRQLSFGALPPPPPPHPRLSGLSGSATDSDDSDSDDSRWLADYDSAVGAVRPPPPEPPSEGDFVVSRGARLPPPYSAGPPRRRRPHLSWLLSCGSRRRPPSPPSAYMSPPPSEPPAPSAGAAYGCNLCKARFAEHFQLVSHVHDRHVRVQMRPKYSCGLCPARFYASKFLARHCAYHHNSMGDARTPQCLKSDSAT